MRSASELIRSSTSDILRRDSIASISTGSSCTRSRSASVSEKYLDSSSAITPHVSPHADIINRISARSPCVKSFPTSRLDRSTDLAFSMASALIFVTPVLNPYRCSSLAANKNHGPRRSHKIRLVDAMPFFFLVYDRMNRVADLAIRRAVAQQAFQIVI